MISGLWRRKERRDWRNLSRFLMDLHLIDAMRLYSTGSSAWRCFPKSDSAPSGRSTRWCLPLPVGPVTRTMPKGLWIGVLEFLQGCSSNPFGHVQLEAGFVQQTHDYFFPKRVEGRTPRKSISLSFPYFTLFDVLGEGGARRCPAWT